MTKQKIIMYLAPTMLPLPAPRWPQGYHLHRYTPGDELHWARVETRVGEFPTTEQALDYFEAIFSPHPARVLFAAHGDHMVGTATMWRAWINGGQVPLLHWLGVDPAHRRQNLGRALVLAALQLAPAGHGVYLSTQASAAPAVWLYHQLGFAICPELTLEYESLHDGVRVTKNSGNDYTEALEHLKQALGPERAQKIKQRAQTA